MRVLPGRAESGPSARGPAPDAGAASAPKGEVGTGHDPHNVGVVEPEDDARRTAGLQSLIDRMPAMVGYWTTDLRNVVVNRAYVEWFAKTPEEVHGRHVSEVIGEDLYRHNRPYLDRALAGEEVVFETRFHDAQGALRSTEVTYRPDVVDGAVTGLFTQVVDVTRRAQAQRQMDEAERLADLGSWVAYPQTGEMTWSQQLFRIVGLDPTTFRPDLESLQPLVHPEDRTRVVATAAEAARSGQPYEQRYRVVRRNGDVREVHSRVRAERAPDGTVVRLLGTMQDVTSAQTMVREIERVNAELRQVNQLNSDVLGVVGHDLRQPLTLLLGHLEELTWSWEETPDDARLTRADKAFGAARRLNTLVDDILAMASADSGALVAHPDDVDLLAVVREALDGVHGGAEVDVRADVDAHVRVDPFQLRQVLVNLVTNALRYGRAPVGVRLHGDDHELLVDVTDRGPGVPAAHLPHLFERFAETAHDQATGAGPGTGRRVPGNGFGLYVVRRLAAANGCRVEHHRAEPVGTTFRVVVPRDLPVGAEGIEPPTTSL